MNHKPVFFMDGSGSILPFCIFFLFLNNLTSTSSEVLPLKGECMYEAIHSLSCLLMGSMTEVGGVPPEWGLTELNHDDWLSSSWMV